MAKKVDPAAKAKRQKIFAAVGGVILLGVLAFQVPRTMKMLHQSNAAAASSSSSSATPATPALGGAATPGTGATSADGLTDPDGGISVQSGQLLSFSRFRSKDPFAQQLNLNCGTSCPSTGPTGATGATGPTGVNPPPGQPPLKPTSAVISVDGASETVPLGGQFPASSPVFVLVSLTTKSAQIGIANGSLAGSQHTATLKKGATLTLQNTSDGTKYVLRLIAVA